MRFRQGGGNMKRKVTISITVIAIMSICILAIIGAYFSTNNKEKIDIKNKIEKTENKFSINPLSSVTEPKSSNPIFINVQQDPVGVEPSSGGYGTVGNPYLIKTLNDYMHYAFRDFGTDKHFKLTNDVVVAMQEATQVRQWLTKIATKQHGSPTDHRNHLDGDGYGIYFISADLSNGKNIHDSNTLGEGKFDNDAHRQGQDAEGLIAGYNKAEIKNTTLYFGPQVKIASKIWDRSYTHKFTGLVSGINFPESKMINNKIIIKDAQVEGVSWNGLLGGRYSWTGGVSGSNRAAFKGNYVNLSGWQAARGYGYAFAGALFGNTEGSSEVVDNVFTRGISNTMGQFVDSNSGNDRFSNSFIASVTRIKSYTEANNIQNNTVAYFGNQEGDRRVNFLYGVHTSRYMGYVNHFQNRTASNNDGKIHFFGLSPFQSNFTISKWGSRIVFDNQSPTLKYKWALDNDTFNDSRLINSSSRQNLETGGASFTRNMFVIPNFYNTNSLNITEQALWDQYALWVNDGKGSTPHGRSVPLPSEYPKELIIGDSNVDQVSLDLNFLTLGRDLSGVNIRGNTPNTMLLASSSGRLTSSLALFGHLKNSSIKNLKISYSAGGVSRNQIDGLIVSEGTNLELSNLDISVSGSVTTHTSNRVFGSLMGQIQGNSKISNIRFTNTGQINVQRTTNSSGQQHYAGLIGWSNNLVFDKNEVNLNDFVIAPHTGVTITDGNFAGIFAGTTSTTKVNDSSFNVKASLILDGGKVGLIATNTENALFSNLAIESSFGSKQSDLKSGNAILSLGFTDQVRLTNVASRVGYSTISESTSSRKSIFMNTTNTNSVDNSILLKRGDKKLNEYSHNHFLASGGNIITEYAGVKSLDFAVDTASSNTYFKYKLPLEVVVKEGVDIGLYEKDGNLGWLKNFNSTNQYYKQTDGFAILAYNRLALNSNTKSKDVNALFIPTVVNDGISFNAFAYVHNLLSDELGINISWIDLNLGYKQNKPNGTENIERILYFNYTGKNGITRPLTNFKSKLVPNDVNTIEINANIINIQDAFNVGLFSIIPSGTIIDGLKTDGSRLKIRFASGQVFAKENDETKDTNPSPENQYDVNVAFFAARNSGTIKNINFEIAGKITGQLLNTGKYTESDPKNQNDSNLIKHVAEVAGLVAINNSGSLIENVRVEILQGAQFRYIDPLNDRRRGSSASAFIGHNFGSVKNSEFILRSTDLVPSNNFAYGLGKVNGSSGSYTNTSFSFSRYALGGKNGKNAYSIRDNYQGQVINSRVALNEDNYDSNGNSDKFRRVIYATATGENINATVFLDTEIMANNSIRFYSNSTDYTISQFRRDHKTGAIITEGVTLASIEIPQSNSNVIFAIAETTLIENLSKLNRIAASVNTGNRYTGVTFKVVNYIEFSGSQLSSSIGSGSNYFDGTILGGSQTITINNANKPIFSNLGENAVIDRLNIKINNATFSDTNNLGLFANTNKGTIKNIILQQNGNLSMAANTVGVFVGLNEGTINKIEIDLTKGAPENNRNIDATSAGLFIGEQLGASAVSNNTIVKVNNRVSFTKSQSSKNSSIVGDLKSGTLNNVVVYVDEVNNSLVNKAIGSESDSSTIINTWLVVKNINDLDNVLSKSSKANTAVNIILGHGGNVEVVLDSNNKVIINAVETDSVNNPYYTYYSRNQKSIISSIIDRKLVSPKINNEVYEGDYLIAIFANGNIKDQKTFNALSTAANLEGLEYNVIQDFTMEAAKNLENIKYVLKGQGYRITINGFENNGKALFNQIDQFGRIENITFNINNTLSTTQDTLAAIVNTNNGNLHDVNVTLNGSITSSKNSAILAGVNNGEISTSTVVARGNLDAKNYISGMNLAGIVALNNATISNSSAIFEKDFIFKASIANGAIGGISAISSNANHLNISASFKGLEIQGHPNFFGGIIGDSNNSTIDNSGVSVTSSIALKSVENMNYFGGAIGRLLNGSAKKINTTIDTIESKSMAVKGIFGGIIGILASGTLTAASAVIGLLGASILGGNSTVLAGGVGLVSSNANISDIDVDIRKTATLKGEINAGLVGRNYGNIAKAQVNIQGQLGDINTYKIANETYASTISSGIIGDMGDGSLQDSQVHISGKILASNKTTTDNVSINGIQTQVSLVSEYGKTASVIGSSSVELLNKLNSVWVVINANNKLSATQDGTKGVNIINIAIQNQIAKISKLQNGQYIFIGPNNQSVKNYNKENWTAIEDISLILNNNTSRDYEIYVTDYNLEISTEDQFIELAKASINGYLSGLQFKLLNDIIINKEMSSFGSIENPFNIVLDGQNNKITINSNLTSSLFDYVGFEGVIKNTEFVFNSNIQSSKSITLAALVGHLDGKIENVVINMISDTKNKNSAVINEYSNDSYTAIIAGVVNYKTAVIDKVFVATRYKSYDLIGLTVTYEKIANKNANYIFDLGYAIENNTSNIQVFSVFGSESIKTERVADGVKYTYEGTVPIARLYKEPEENLTIANTYTTTNEDFGKNIVLSFFDTNIKNEQDLVLLSQLTRDYSTDGIVFTQTQDITLTDKTFKSIGSIEKMFDGTYNGNNKKITINTNITGELVGLFGAISKKAKINNLTVEYANNLKLGTVETSYFGGIVAYSKGQLSNLKVIINSKPQAQIAGVAVGYSDHLSNSNDVIAITTVDGIESVGNGNQFTIIKHLRAKHILEYNYSYNNATNDLTINTAEFAGYYKLNDGILSKISDNNLMSLASITSYSQIYALSLKLNIATIEDYEIFAKEINEGINLKGLNYNLTADIQLNNKTTKPKNFKGIFNGMMNRISYLDQIFNMFDNLSSDAVVHNLQFIITKPLKGINVLANNSKARVENVFARVSSINNLDTEIDNVFISNSTGITKNNVVIVNNSSQISNKEFKNVDVIAVVGSINISDVDVVLNGSMVQILAKDGQFRYNNEFVNSTEALDISNTSDKKSKYYVTSFNLKIANEEDWFNNLVSSWKGSVVENKQIYDLTGIKFSLTANIKITRDIDSANILGNIKNQFMGIIDGQNHKLTILSNFLASNDDAVGLIGYLGNNGLVENLYLEMGAKVKNLSANAKNNIGFIATSNGRVESVIAEVIDEIDINYTTNSGVVAGFAASSSMIDVVLVVKAKNAQKAVGNQISNVGVKVVNIVGDTTGISYSLENKKVTFNKLTTQKLFIIIPLLGETRVNDKFILPDGGTTYIISSINGKIETDQDINYISEAVGAGFDISLIINNIYIEKDITLSNYETIDLLKLEFRGNGHKILFSGAKKPIFNTISANGSISSLKLQFEGNSSLLGDSATALLANINDGTIMNIEIISSPGAIIEANKIAMLVGYNKATITNVSGILDVIINGREMAAGLVVINDGIISSTDKKEIVVNSNITASLQDATHTVAAGLVAQQNDNSVLLDIKAIFKNASITSSSLEKAIAGGITSINRGEIKRVIAVVEYSDRDFLKAQAKTSFAAVLSGENHYKVLDSIVEFTNIENRTRDIITADNKFADFNGGYSSNVWTLQPVENKDGFFMNEKARGATLGVHEYGSVVYTLNGDEIKFTASAREDLDYRIANWYHDLKFETPITNLYGNVSVDRTSLIVSGATQANTTGKIFNVRFIKSKIATFADLKALHDSVLSGLDITSIEYLLEADITIEPGFIFGKIDENTSVPFSGILNGQNHTITIPAGNYTGKNVGLFAKISKTGSINNLNIINNATEFGSVNTEHAGTVTSINEGSIKSIAQSSQITNNTNIKAIYTAGVVVGKNIGSISNIYATNNNAVTTARYSGGISGENTDDASIVNSTIENKGSIDSVTYSGGVSGISYGMLSNILVIHKDVKSKITSSNAAGLISNTMPSTSNIAIEYRPVNDTNKVADTIGTLSINNLSNIWVLSNEVFSLTSNINTIHDPKGIISVSKDIQANELSAYEFKINEANLEAGKILIWKNTNTANLAGDENAQASGLTFKVPVNDQRVNKSYVIEFIDTITNRYEYNEFIKSQTLNEYKNTNHFNGATIKLASDIDITNLATIDTLEVNFDGQSNILKINRPLFKTINSNISNIAIAYSGDSVENLVYTQKGDTNTVKNIAVYLSGDAVDVVSGVSVSNKTIVTTDETNVENILVILSKIIDSDKLSSAYSKHYIVGNGSVKAKFLADSVTVEPVVNDGVKFYSQRTISTNEKAYYFISTDIKNYDDLLMIDEVVTLFPTNNTINTLKFNLVNDIIVNSKKGENQFIVSKPFKASLDGNGHKIVLNVDGYALFNSIETASINNLVIYAPSGVNYVVANDILNAKLTNVVIVLNKSTASQIANTNTNNNIVNSFIIDDGTKYYLSTDNSFAKLKTNNMAAIENVDIMIENNVVKFVQNKDKTDIIIIKFESDTTSFDSEIINYNSYMTAAKTVPFTANTRFNLTLLDTTINSVEKWNSIASANTSFENINFTITGNFTIGATSITLNNFAGNIDGNGYIIKVEKEGFIQNFNGSFKNTIFDLTSLTADKLQVVLTSGIDNDKLLNVWLVINDENTFNSIPSNNRLNILLNSTASSSYIFENNYLWNYSTDTTKSLKAVKIIDKITDRIVNIDNYYTYSQPNQDLSRRYVINESLEIRNQEDLQLYQHANNTQSTINKNVEFTLESSFEITRQLIVAKQANGVSLNGKGNTITINSSSFRSIHTMDNKTLKVKELVIVIAKGSNYNNSIFDLTMSFGTLNVANLVFDNTQNPLAKLFSEKESITEANARQIIYVVDKAREIDVDYVSNSSTKILVDLNSGNLSYKPGTDGKVVITLQPLSDLYSVVGLLTESNGALASDNILNKNITLEKIRRDIDFVFEAKMLKTFVTNAEEYNALVETINEYAVVENELANTNIYLQPYSVFDFVSPNIIKTIKLKGIEFAGAIHGNNSIFNLRELNSTTAYTNFTGIFDSLNVTVENETPISNLTIAIYANTNKAFTSTDTSAITDIVSSKVSYTAGVEIKPQGTWLISSIDSISGLGFAKLKINSKAPAQGSYSFGIENGQHILSFTLAEGTRVEKWLVQDVRLYSVTSMTLPVPLHFADISNVYISNNSELLVKPVNAQTLQELISVDTFDGNIAFDKLFTIQNGHVFVENNTVQNINIAYEVNNFEEKGYIFTGYYLNDQLLSNNINYSHTITEDSIIQARFIVHTAEDLSDIYTGKSIVYDDAMIKAKKYPIVEGVTYDVTLTDSSAYVGVKTVDDVITIHVKAMSGDKVVGGFKVSQNIVARELSINDLTADINVVAEEKIYDNKTNITYTIKINDSLLLDASVVSILNDKLFILANEAAHNEQIIKLDQSHASIQKVQSRLYLGSDRNVYFAANKVSDVAKVKIIPFSINIKAINGLSQYYNSDIKGALLSSIIGENTATFTFENKTAIAGIDSTIKVEDLITGSLGIVKLENGKYIYNTGVVKSAKYFISLGNIKTTNSNYSITLINDNTAQFEVKKTTIVMEIGDLGTYDFFSGISYSSVSSLNETLVAKDLLYDKVVSVNGIAKTAENLDLIKSLVSIDDLVLDFYGTEESRVNPDLIRKVNSKVRFLKSGTQSINAIAKNTEDIQITINSGQINFNKLTVSLIADKMVDEYTSEFRQLKYSAPELDVDLYVTGAIANKLRDSSGYYPVGEYKITPAVFIKNDDVDVTEHIIWDIKLKDGDNITNITPSELSYSIVKKKINVELVKVENKEYGDANSTFNIKSKMPTGIRVEGLLVIKDSNGKDITDLSNLEIKKGGYDVVGLKLNLIFDESSTLNANNFELTSNENIKINDAAKKLYVVKKRIQLEFDHLSTTYGKADYPSKILFKAYDLLSNPIASLNDSKFTLKYTLNGQESSMTRIQAGNYVLSGNFTSDNYSVISITKGSLKVAKKKIQLRVGDYKKGYAQDIDTELIPLLNWDGTPFNQFEYEDGPSDLSIEYTWKNRIGVQELSVVSQDSFNYSFDILKDVKNGKITIHKTVIVLKFSDPITKKEGQDDPRLVWTDFIANDADVDDTVFSGTITREQGEKAGTYKYTKGNLSVPEDKYELKIEFDKKAVLVIQKDGKNWPGKVILGVFSVMISLLVMGGIAKLYQVIVKKRAK